MRRHAVAKGKDWFARRFLKVGQELLSLAREPDMPAQGRRVTARDLTRLASKVVGQGLFRRGLREIEVGDGPLVEVGETPELTHEGMRFVPLPRQHVLDLFVQTSRYLVDGVPRGLTRPRQYGSFDQGRDPFCHYSRLLGRGVPHLACASQSTPIAQLAAPKVRRRVRLVGRELDLYGAGGLIDAEEELLAWFDESKINLLAIPERAFRTRVVSRVKVKLKQHVQGRSGRKVKR